MRPLLLLAVLALALPAQARDRTEPLAARRALETLRALGGRGAPARVPRSLPLAPETPDILLVQAEACEQGCILAGPEPVEGRDHYELDAYRVLDAAYAQVGDDYDVVVVWTTFHTTWFGGAFTIPIANDVRGINADQSGAFTQEVFNYGPDVYGGERLRSVIVMQDWFQCAFWKDQGAPCDLEPPFDESYLSPYGLLAEEVGHQWGAFVEIGGPRPGALLGRDAAHWSYLHHTGGSPLEGNAWVDAGDGFFETAAVGAVRYSALDLYLMGLLPPSEVEGIWYIESDAVDPALPPWPVPDSATGAPGPQRVQGTRVDVSIDAIVAAEGTRLPTWRASPKLQNQLWVLVHRPGESVDAHLNDLGRMRAHWNEMLYRITDRRLRAITTVSGRDDFPLWRFGASTEGWGPAIWTPTGIEVEGALEHPAVRIDAPRWRWVEVVASTSGPAGGLLAWEGSAGPGETALPLIADGTLRTYVLDLGSAPTWGGTIDALRLDLGGRGVLRSLRFGERPLGQDGDGDGLPDAADPCPTDPENLCTARGCGCGSGGGAGLAGLVLGLLALAPRRR